MTAFPDPLLSFAQQPDLVLAALTCYGEARGEPSLGKKGVLWAIKNRCQAAKDRLGRGHGNHPLFGDGSVASAVLKPYQFSCWLKGDPNLAVLSLAVESAGRSVPAGVWAVIYALAEKVWEEEPVADPTWGSTHYCTAGLWETPDTLAWYGKPEIEAGRTVEKVKLGNHVFAKVA